MTNTEEYDRLSENCVDHVIHDGWGGCDLLENLECCFENCPKIREKKPVLEGFEKVIGEKWSCKHCFYYFMNRRNDEFSCIPYSIRSSYDQCNRFKLSDATKAEIKLKDTEIAETKIDTHPRFEIFGTILWDKYGNKIKKGLEIIL